VRRSVASWLTPRRKLHPLHPPRRTATQCKQTRRKARVGPRVAAKTAPRCLRARCKQSGRCKSVTRTSACCRNHESAGVRARADSRDGATASDPRGPRAEAAAACAERRLCASGRHRVRPPERAATALVSCRLVPRISGSPRSPRRVRSTPPRSSQGPGNQTLAFSSPRRHGHTR
jgi:hypothetical protein